MSEPLRVLLIGESPGNLGEMLRTCGRKAELIHRERPRDGLALASGGEIDVVLLDLDLADGEGTAFLDRLRRTAPDIPVIVLTAAGEDRAAFHAMQSGAQDYLVREKTDAELLCRAIRYAQERMRAEVLLRHSEAMYRRLIENLNEGIIAVDEAGLITFANPRMGEIFGCPARRLVGLPIAGFIAGENIPAAPNPFCRQTDQRQEFEQDLIRCDGGQVHALVATSPIVDAAGAPLGCLQGCSTSPAASRPRRPSGRASRGIDWSWRASARGYG